MTRQLVLVHGRSQQQLDSDDLKKSWIDAFRSGLEKNGLDLPIDESDIRFPYYGDTLHDLVSGVDEDQIAEVVVKGDSDNSAEAEFARQMIEEIRIAAGIIDEDVRQAAGSDSLEKGWQNWEWVQNVLEVLDQRVPGASKLTVALATKDVYAYLRNPGFQGVIDRGVSASITAGVETVVVGHSLGSVVSYNLLARDGERLANRSPEMC